MSDTTVEVRVPDLLTVMEAGAVARISRTTAYELAHQFLATNGKAGMPAKRVGGQIRIPRDRFEEWIGTAITVWPPVTSDIDIDDVNTVAVNDTPKSITSTKPSRRTTSSRRTPTPQNPQLFSV
jgi:excisionase family DNA binding protein